MSLRWLGPAKSSGSHARTRLKSAMRSVGLATSSIRPAPDFLVIGAKRGGTTSFYYDLLDHPSVMRLFPPPLPVVKPDATKGVHYFDSNYWRGERWYRSFMPTSLARSVVTRCNGVEAVVGEASPYYLFHPAAAERARRSVPDARIIALLRDPSARAYSHWKERRRGGAEPLGFVEALQAEEQRLRGEKERLLADPTYSSYAWEQQSYVGQSMYFAALHPWVEAFGLKQIYVSASETYYEDPVRVLGEVHDFLGIPRRARSTGKVRNAAAGQALDPDTESMLASLFADDKDRLVRLLGRSLPWT